MEPKRLNKNLLAGLAVILVIAAVGLFAGLQKKEINPTLGALPADTASVPTVSPEPEQTAPTAALAPAQAYLVVTVAGAMYEPIPLYASGRYTVRQGEDMINVIEVTPDSVRMHSSSCENQDCVEQGIVTLENREKRVLQNMVICLPNQVTLELYTPEEIAQLLLYMAGYTGEDADE